VRVSVMRYPASGVTTFQVTGLMHLVEPAADMVKRLFEKVPGKFKETVVRDPWKIQKVNGCFTVRYRDMTVDDPEGLEIAVVNLIAEHGFYVQHYVKDRTADSLEETFLMARQVSVSMELPR